MHKETLTLNLIMFFICCSVALKSEIRKLNIVHVLIWVLMAAQVSLVLSGLCYVVLWSCVPCQRMLWGRLTFHLTC